MGVAAGKKGLRMKELLAATGVPKSAILHYVAQGLLPEPSRTGRNMAYYDPSCVERLRFIREMQQTYSFPLEKIKSLLEKRDRGADIGSLVELGQRIFGEGGGKTFDKAGFLRETGLSAKQMVRLAGLGLLLPLDDGRFNGEDVAVGRVFKGSFDAGIDVSLLGVYAQAAKMIVDMEMEVRRARTGHLPEAEDAAVTGRMVEYARLVRNYVIDRTFKRRVRGFDNLKGSGE